MPVHDWTRVPREIFHAFHHTWISELSRVLNNGLLPSDLYALLEPVAASFSPDVLTLQSQYSSTRSEPGDGCLSVIAIRHVSGDRIVALVEIISPGNKSGEYQIESFVRKACDFLEQGVHLLILDLFPPGPRDPDGIHALIWRELHPEPFHLPPETPLTLVSYECELAVQAYIEPVAVGDTLPDMPLFLVPAGYVMVPLEQTYQAAFAVQPLRWRTVLEPQTG
ncbi:DUF4058 family protein [Fimbriiglobus ruber]|uniref:DUF4058 domain-containing protein n=1 Tax=Fimbriiglobus ruber TaxID=1908690 RepID=A0A225DLJ6_9BACT|nr:DUF4058 family protein [Fimbriiglobus ruber]OWK38356.1 hypothetical protein FRUB_07476 [Fimbriiglobus ruber]